MIDSMEKCIEMAIEATDLGEHDCKIDIEIEGKKYAAYTVNVAERELLFFCDGVTATFDVNSIGGRDSALLVDWTFEGEE